MTQWFLSFVDTNEKSFNPISEVEIEKKKF